MRLELIPPEPQSGVLTLELRSPQWVRGWDLNPRPSGYEPDELPIAPPRSMPMFLFVRKHGNAGPALAEISPLCVRRSPVPALEPPEGFEPSSMRSTNPPFCLLNYGGAIGITNCILYAIINWRREERYHRNSSYGKEYIRRCRLCSSCTSLSSRCL